MLVGSMLPVVLAASKDRVPNVKFNVAKILQTVAPLVEPSVLEATVKPCLQELAEDGDTDVRYYARQALQVC